MATEPAMLPRDAAHPEPLRLLFTFVGGSGHCEPLLPIARAAQVAGHAVAVSGRAALMPALEARGFTAFATRPPTGPAPPRQRTPLAPVSMAHEEQVLREVFAGRAARERFVGIQEVCARWRPDVIVCDEVDFGAMLAAERLVLPYASVVVIAAGSFVRPVVVGEPLNALRAEVGLPPDPQLAMLSRHLVLSPVPPSFRDPRFPLPATAHSLRPPTPAPIATAAPRWPARLAGRPLVYCTLGTEFNLECGDLFARLLAGLRDAPITLVVTVGHEIDPAEFGPQPDHILVERYIDQATVMPHCASVICHGGSGSVLGALAHGLPLVVLPMGADQPPNAGRCAALGVGCVLDALIATPADIGDAVAAVLTEPTYRTAAHRLRAEFQALPGPESAVAALERLRA